MDFKVGFWADREGEGGCPGNTMVGLHEQNRKEVILAEALNLRLNLGSMDEQRCYMRVCPQCRYEVWVGTWVLQPIVSAFTGTNSA